MLELEIKQRVGDLVLNVAANLPGDGITAIFGLSGAGKTSLINVIAGLSQPDYARIVLNRRILNDTSQKIALSIEQRRIGYVFQDARLFPHYRVKGNLCYGMAAGMRTQFDSIVELLGINSLLSRYPATLSGGEKQRVAIGRALLTAPDLLLMDEPLAALDLPRKHELLPYLEQLAAEIHIPILYVTHSLDEIVRLADHLLVLEQGEVKACGELSQVWQDPALTPWRIAEQSMIVKVHLQQHHPKYPMSGVRLGKQLLWLDRIERPIGSVLHLRIAAKEVSITLTPPAMSSIRNVLPVQVVQLTDVGHQVQVTLQIDEQLLLAQITPWARDELALRPGCNVYAQLKSVALTV